MKKLFFSIKGYELLTEEIRVLCGGEKGEVIRKDFPDDEHYSRIMSDVKDHDVVVVGGTVSDASTMELFSLACALVKYGAKTLSVVIPYYGYSTMERAVKSGEVVGAKTRARLLSAIPQASQGNTIFLVDLHSEGIPYYFEGNTNVFHVYAKEVIIEMIKDFAEGQDFVLASTDAGRAKWVQSLANDLGVMPAFVYKRRISGSKTEVVGVNADVLGKHVIIYDDMIRTGGSLKDAASAYLKAGAVKVSAVTTHGVLPGDSLDKLVDSKLFYKIGLTNSHNRVEKLPKTPSVVITSIASTIAEKLK